jgi:hypothetical protein
MAVDLMALAKKADETYLYITYRMLCYCPLVLTRLSPNCRTCG